METALADFGKSEGARLQKAFETANEDRWKSLGSRATDEDKMDSITKGQSFLIAQVDVVTNVFTRQ